MWSSRKALGKLKGVVSTISRKTSKCILRRSQNMVRLTFVKILIRSTVHKHVKKYRVPPGSSILAERPKLGDVSVILTISFC